MILFVVRYLVTLFVLGLSTIAIADQASVPVDAGLAAANPEKTPNPPLDPSLTRLINEIKKDSEFYPADAAKALAHLGEVEAAKVILGKARIVTEYPSAMLEIGKVQAELGERHAALKTMLRARQLFLREEQSDSGVAEDLTRVAKEQRKLGDLAAAEKSFEEAMRSVEGLSLIHI